MIYFYDILFSIQIKMDGQISNDFSITPTPECRKKLTSLSLIFKRLEDKVIVIVEKIGDERITAEPARKIRKVMDFTFLLHLNNFELLNEFKPFKRPSTSPFPLYSGRSRKLYFNNLNSAFNIEDSRKELTEGVNTNNVDDVDLGSVTINKFSYTEREPSVILQNIEFNKVHPEGETISPFDPTSTDRTAQVELDKGAYLITRGSGQSKEILFAQSSLVASNALGIIQIFKDETIDYQQIDYEIPFVT